MAGGWNADVEGARLHVALVAPPFVRVPPPAYGGTELVVADLAKALVALGHRVTLFATGDSVLPGVETRHLFRRPLWPPEPLAEWNHGVFAANAIADLDVDVVHSHLTSFPAFAPQLGAPLVHTVHHGEDAPLARHYAGRTGVRFVCLSQRQARLLEGELPATPMVVPHGLDASRYPLGTGDAGDALFIGRLDAVKAPHLAVEAARAAGFPLRIAGRPHEGDYFAQLLAPALTGGGVRLVGELGGAEKIRALGSARVLVFPSVREEPFGLAAVEALLCGTPVAALRRGALPEIVEDGVTGCLVDRPSELAAAIRVAATLDRETVRARARERFSVDRMTRDYVAIYRSLLQAAETEELAATM